MDRNEIEEWLRVQEQTVEQLRDRWAKVVADDGRSFADLQLADERERACQIVSHLLQAQTWRPISEARKDGTPYLIYNSERCSCCPPDARGLMVGRWFKVGWMVGRNQKGVNVFANHQPTHFMDLPEPPSSFEEAERSTPSDQQSRE